MTSAAPHFPNDWNIEDYALLADTNSSHIWEVSYKDEFSAKAIVKSLKPSGLDELRGAYYLYWRDGKGAIKLLGFHLNSSQMLMEYAGAYDLNSLINDEGDAASIVISGEILRALQSPNPKSHPSQLLSMRQHFSSLLNRQNPAHSIYNEAAIRITALMQQPHPIIPLHGDLHHQNILRSSRGWLAIDPHGVSGDPAFDCANLFYNPLERDDLCFNMERAAKLANYYASIIRRPATVILDYAFCYGALSAAWHSEANNHQAETRSLQIASALHQLRRKT